MSKQTTDSYLDPASRKQNLHPFAPPEPFSHLWQVGKKSNAETQRTVNMCRKISCFSLQFTNERTDWNQGWIFLLKPTLLHQAKTQILVLKDWSFTLCATWQSPDAVPPPDFILNSHRGITETWFTMTRTWANNPPSVKHQSRIFKHATTCMAKYVKSSVRFFSVEKYWKIIHFRGKGKEWIFSSWNSFKCHLKLKGN